MYGIGQVPGGVLGVLADVQDRRVDLVRADEPRVVTTSPLAWVQAGMPSASSPTLRSTPMFNAGHRMSAGS